MEEFETLLKELEALKHEHSALFAQDEFGRCNHPLQVAYRQALEADWQSANPKSKKFDAAKAPNAGRIQSEHSAVVDAWVKEHIHRPMLAVEERLFMLAPDLSVPLGEEWTEIGHAWDSTYRSQAWAASKYASAAAHAIADHAAFYGAEARVERYGEGASAGFRVEARTTAAGAEILAHKPDVPLKAWIDACTHRGVNPRVFRPFLPYD